jgi:hypothetical protein
MNNSIKRRIDVFSVARAYHYAVMIIALRAICYKYLGEKQLMDEAIEEIPALERNHERYHSGMTAPFNFFA